MSSNERPSGCLRQFSFGASSHFATKPTKAVASTAWHVFRIMPHSCRSPYTLRMHTNKLHVHTIK
jgi:hypothetical protein